jgi:hypothetical protein
MAEPRLPVSWPQVTLVSVAGVVLLTGIGLELFGGPDWERTGLLAFGLGSLLVVVSGCWTFRRRFRHDIEAHQKNRRT